MRYLVGLICVLALGVMGCSETAGTGGSGGSGGSGGTGDAMLCEGVTCEDAECKIDGVCNASDGMCDFTLAEDGTACSEGECLGGVCAPVGAFPCSARGIRDAIAEGGGPHFFACDGPTTVETQAEIVIDNSVILDGEGNLIVDGDDDHRVFSVPVGVTAELRGFTVQKGWLNDETSFLLGSGAGIHNGGEMAIFDTIVSRNGLNLGRGGGIHNAGKMSITDTIVSDNYAMHGIGGGVSNAASGTLMLIGSTVSDNDAGFDGGGTAGGGIYNAGEMTMLNSTVSRNSAECLGACNGGGIGNVGKTTILNSTLSGNSADFGDAIGTESHPLAPDVPHFEMANTLIDGDCDESLEYASEPEAIWVSNGYNIESPGNTCGFDQLTDQVDIPDPMLGPLQDNGGPTETHALLPDSVAIDVIPGEECVDVEDLALATDQRGVARPQGLECDVGAFEYADCAGSPCDDGKECIADHCNPSDSSWCAHTILPDATFCDLGGEDGVCFSGACVPNSCPMLFYINASPSTIPSGQSTTMIETRARDADGLPLPLLLSLSAPWGSFENTEDIQEPDNVVIQQARYVCDRPGLVEICAEATDGACVRKLCTDVMCPTQE